MTGRCNHCARPLEHRPPYASISSCADLGNRFACPPDQPEAFLRDCNFTVPTDYDWSAVTAADKLRAEETSRRAYARFNDDSPWHVVLGVAPTAPVEERRKAYRALALIHHPDQATGTSWKMKRLNRAKTEAGL